MLVGQGSVLHTQPNDENLVVSASGADAANAPRSTQREDASLHSAAWRRDELQQELRTLIFQDGRYGRAHQAMHARRIRC